MSTEADEWAYRQETPSPAVQIVLILLARIADQNGNIQFISVEYLFRKARQSKASTFRRLNELEELGLLTRIKKFVNRRAIISGKLHLERTLRDGDQEPSDPVAEALESALVAPDQEPLAVDSAKPNFGPSEENDDSQIENRQSEGSTILNLRVEDSHSSESRGFSLLRVPYKDKGNLIIESSSTTALQKQIEEVEKADIEFQKRLGADWERFKEAYPLDASMDRDATREALGELSLGDRDKCIRAVPKYLAVLAAKKRSFPMDAINFIRKRKFDEIVDAEQEQAERAGFDKPKTVFVSYPSEAFDAWDAHARRHGRIGYPHTIKNDKGQSGWMFPTLYPPKDPTPPEEPVSF